MMPSFIDLTGHIYGRLTVISRVYGTKFTTWNCLCSCGNKKIASSNTLRNEHTKSCGCLNRELASKRTKSHGRSGCNEYNSWSTMKGRCTNPQNPHYRNYGGRGITICDKWMTITGFLEDMGSKPTPQHTIERVDNDGGYNKENCVWATRQQQARNHRINHNNKTGITGVYEYQNDRWIASIGINGKSKHLGVFDNLLDAACARKSAENRYWT